MNTSLFVAWRSGDADHGHWGPVGRLDRMEHGYRFVYTRGARSLPGFTPFPGMPDYEAVYESDDLFPMFANRLLGRRRPEYDEYLTWGGFDPKAPPDAISILAVTEGRRATDSFEVFPCPTPDANGHYVGTFFLHGIRHMNASAIGRIAHLKPDEPLDMVREESNTFDRYAVAVHTRDVQRELKIGYVPRYLARDVRALWEEHSADTFLRLTVARVNHYAPIQQRVLCRMEAKWPETFVPCSGDEFQPIVAEDSIVTR